MTAWAPKAEDIGMSEGDYTAVLKKVKQQYLDKAAEMDERAYGEDADVFKAVAEIYRQDAARVDLLITQ